MTTTLAQLQACSSPLASSFLPCSAASLLRQQSTCPKCAPALLMVIGRPGLLKLPVARGRSRAGSATGASRMHGVTEVCVTHAKRTREQTAGARLAEGFVRLRLGALVQPPASRAASPSHPVQVPSREQVHCLRHMELRAVQNDQGRRRRCCGACGGHVAECYNFS